MVIQEIGRMGQMRGGDVDGGKEMEFPGGEGGWEGEPDHPRAS